MAGILWTVVLIFATLSLGGCGAYPYGYGGGSGSGGYGGYGASGGCGGGYGYGGGSGYGGGYPQGEYGIMPPMAYAPGSTVIVQPPASPFHRRHPVPGAPVVQPVKPKPVPAEPVAKPSKPTTPATPGVVKPVTPTAPGSRPALQSPMAQSRVGPGGFGRPAMPTVRQPGRAPMQAAAPRVMRPGPMPGRAAAPAYGQRRF